MWHDFILSLGREQIHGAGEDAHAFSIENNAGTIGVFDGLGGSGARKYTNYNDHSGAYMASRAVAGAFRDWSTSLLACEGVDDSDLKKRITANLQYIKDNADETERSFIKGSISREFPTTAAMAVVIPRGERYSVDYIWAGDSRGYLLTEQGLIQITSDDVEKTDIRSSMSADVPMTNVISLSHPWYLTNEVIHEQTAGIVITATDGCFGYWRSPMDFEYQLVNTFLESDSFFDWEKRLDDAIQSVTGDDFTLCALAFGFKSIANMKESFKARRNYLKEVYIEPMDKLNPEDSEDYERILDMWEKYSETYLWKK